MAKEDVKQYILDNEEMALEKATKILGKLTSMQSFNGIIGGKNAIYEVNALDYSTPENYVEAWMESHKKSMRMKGILVSKRATVFKSTFIVFDYIYILVNGCF